ncbi:hypothetical protein ACH4GM_05325 [Streptomyces coeruleorubidus]|uniref:hypothetical protein n=1 Tax=Streptomyces coeruleorubidus TaxID=116188 RepID=UPI003794F999
MSGAIPAVAGVHHDGMAQKAAASEPSAEPEVTAESPVHELPGGMDPMSVCLAVLTVWLIGLFLHALVVRRQERLTALLTRSMALARPSTPPPRPLLSQLSVLRI